MVAPQLSDGKYLVILEQSMDKIDTFDMERSRVSISSDIKLDARYTLLDWGEPNRGLYKIWTVANVIAFCGLEKHFPVSTLVIYQEDKNGKMEHALLIGALNTWTEDQRKRLMSCVNNDIGYITKDMWYIMDWKGPSSNSKKIKTESAGEDKRSTETCTKTSDK